MKNTHFLGHYPNYTNPALDRGWIEITETEPNHPNQKYRLTEKGLKAKQEWKNIRR